MTMGDTNIKVLRLQLPSPNYIPYITSSSSSSEHIEQRMNEEIRECVSRILL